MYSEVMQSDLGSQIGLSHANKERFMRCPKGRKNYGGGDDHQPTNEDANNDDGDVSFVYTLLCITRLSTRKGHKRTSTPTTPFNGRPERRVSFL